jgi:tetratricopeptide (TPR) repeat protein
MLRRALAAPTPRSRALWARRGLAVRSPLDRTTQAMLLRQLYLALYEVERFEQASEIAEQAVHLDVLPDVAHQDAARARQALGDVEGAAGHLRLAARLGPPNRKAFHWWTLGSLYFLAQRYAEASAAMVRAARWGTTDKPLYQAHLALAQVAGGQAVEDLDELLDKLAAVPAGTGYGRFVLGMLAIHAGRHDDARRWLEAFVKRSTAGRAVMAIALRGEVEAARHALSLLPKA